MDERKIYQADIVNEMFAMAIQSHAMIQATQLLLVQQIAGNDAEMQSEIINDLRVQANKIIESIAERLYAEYGILPKDIQDILNKPLE